MFKIDVENLSWMNGFPDNNEDLCAHGHAIVQIGNEHFEYDATVSATALYLLKSLSEDHFIDKGEQMLPCCGFSIYARDEQLNCVDIIGCANGIDWSVIHLNNYVKLITSTGKETLLSLSEYRKTVFAFADKIEAFYQQCSPKTLPHDIIDRDGYIAFWSEWHKLRYLV